MILKLTTVEDQSTFILNSEYFVSASSYEAGEVEYEDGTTLDIDGSEVTYNDGNGNDTIEVIESPEEIYAMFQGTYVAPTQTAQLSTGAPVNANGTIAPNDPYQFHK
jgi:hypothetical protein